MIDLDAKEMVFAVKIIYLDTKVSIKKIIVALIFEMNVGSIHIVMTFMN